MYSHKTTHLAAANTATASSSDDRYSDEYKALPSVLLFSDYSEDEDEEDEFNRSLKDFINCFVKLDSSNPLPTEKSGTTLTSSTMESYFLVQEEKKENKVDSNPNKKSVHFSEEVDYITYTALESSKENFDKITSSKQKFCIRKFGPETDASLLDLSSRRGFVRSIARKFSDTTDANNIARQEKGVPGKKVKSYLDILITKDEENACKNIVEKPQATSSVASNMHSPSASATASATSSATASATATATATATASSLKTTNTKKGSGTDEDHLIEIRSIEREIFNHSKNMKGRYGCRVSSIAKKFS